MQIKTLEKGIRLDLFLEKNIDSSRSQIKNQIIKGNILVNGKSVKAGYILRENDIIDVFEDTFIDEQIKPEDIKLDIVYQDDDLLVINKPQGMVVHPAAGNYSGTLVNGLLYNFKQLSEINGENRPGIVHRLDKDTSGLMLVAKNNMSHVSLAKQIEEKSCIRKYLALLEGRLKEDSGYIETRIGRSPTDRTKMAVLKTGGKIAKTNFKVKHYYEKYTLVEFTLQTGRTHQIRVHAKYINHPVVGDKDYGRENKTLNGQLLHSYYIEFSHPRTNERLNFQIPLPDYFQNFIDKIKK